MSPPEAPSFLGGSPLRRLGVGHPGVRSHVVYQEGIASAGGELPNTSNPLTPRDQPVASDRTHVWPPPRLPASRREQNVHFYPFGSRPPCLHSLSVKFRTLPPKKTGVDPSSRRGPVPVSGGFVFPPCGPIHRCGREVCPEVCQTLGMVNFLSLI